MFNETEMKMIQMALDYILCDNEDMTASEQHAARKAYEKCDRFIDGEVIASTWDIDDVKSLQDDEDEFDESERITDDEAKEVLQMANDNHDATVGINWDVLQSHLDHVRESN